MRNAVAITFWKMALLGHLMIMSFPLNDGKDIVIVTKSCPETLTEQGDIIILADHIRTHPFASCRHQHEHYFDEIAIAVYRLQFQLNGNWKRSCIAMLQTTGGYQIEIIVPSEGTPLTGQSQVLNVTCPSPQLTNSLTIDDSPTNRKTQSGQNSSYFFNQSKTEEEILWMDDASFGTEPVPIILSAHYEVEGNWALITLSAMLTNTQTTAKGITPVWCLAHYRRSKIVILNNGCGNGTVIPKISGFHVASYVSWSPVFKLPLHSSQSPLEIECQFGLCKTNVMGFPVEGFQ
ncbi:uncharacterized protein LOC118768025 [Octopus sinensis]|uniref:Uncharacterized protein LOC118768025 n=1 Tax=Octopus sinensis TaxID=2607531 RepID=A0A7E6FRV9_9MOLL|nr:uncharacterized protein LOC118768025 [Octopus sinensis]